MKQNERILVYLVTGFLAVILVVAVFFGREGSAATKPNSDDTVRGLGQILDQKPMPGESTPGESTPGESVPGERGVGGDSTTPGSAKPGKPQQGDPAGNGEQAGTPSDVTRPPLVASVPVGASARVAQLLGDSSRDRTVRIVTARAGDSLESLVRRWCGKRSPFLEEAKSLNEDLTILRLGQKVAVPWVNDEVVLAAFEARQPKLLAGSGRPEPATQLAGQPAPSASPTFQVPGAGASPGNAGGNTGAGVPATPVAGEHYVVKKNDSLWKIAARRYGDRNATRMIKEIKQLNGLTSDRLRPDQELIMPAGS